MSPLRHHFLKLAGLRELTKLDEALAKLLSYRQSGLLAGGNHAENMRQVWRTSDILRSRFRQPPTLDEAFNHVGGLLRNGEVGSVAKKAAALPYKDGEFTGELGDLVQTVKGKRLGDIPEAIDNVSYAGQRWYGKTFDSKRRLTGATAKKVRQRAAVWRNMFARHHIPFSPHYLTAGDDFTNPAAVRNAFLAAGKQIDDNEALQMSVRMSDAYKVNTGEMDSGLLKQAANMEGCYHLLGCSEMEKEAMARRLMSGAAVKMGLKPGFREMMKIRRGLNVVEDLPNGRQRFHIGNRVPGARERELARGLQPLPPNVGGHYQPSAANPAMAHVRLGQGATRNTRRHELAHAYQWQGGGLMRRMADWRNLNWQNPGIRNSIGDAAVEAHAQIVGNKSVLKGLQAWGRVAPLYAKGMSVQGANALPYQASRIIGHGAGAAQAAGKAMPYVAGTTVAAGAGLMGLGAMAGQSATAQDTSPQFPSPYGGGEPFQPYTPGPYDAPMQPSPFGQEHYGAPTPYQPDYDMNKMATESAASIATQLRHARNKTHTHPTPGQAHAGNYSKGTLILHGMAVKLENPKGTERRGYDKDGNITWRRTMQADYGYFQGTKAVDGDAVDCFLGPDIDSHFVLAVDQMKSDGSFDETKFILGCTSQEQAEKLYLAHYPRGWNLGPTSTTTVQQLKAWLKEGDTKSPFKGQMVKAADWQNTCPGCGAEGTYGGDREKPSKELCYKCAEASAPKCEHGINVPFNTCDQGCKAPIEKAAVVKQDDDTGKWILWTRDKKRKLGTHDTPEEAYAQEYAIQKSQEARSEFSLSKAASAPTFSSHLDSPKYFGRPGSRVTASMLLASANRNGVDPRLLAAIAANESGWGTHRNATSANNFTGMMGNGNELFKYDTPQDGLDAAAKLLKRRYVAKGLDTPEKIGPVYAPTVAATNDPNGINNNWVPTVNSILGRIPSPGGRQPSAAPKQPTRPTWVRGSMDGPGMALPSLPTRPVVVQGSRTGPGTVMPTFAKQASLASTMKKTGPYLTAVKELMVGSKPPASVFPAPALPAGSEDISQLVPKLMSLLRFTITGSSK